MWWDDENPDDTPDYQGSLETARASGYSWGDIWSWLTGGTAAAADAGYTQPEIDKHLGFVDPAGFEHQAKSAWTQSIASDTEPPVKSDYTAALLSGAVRGPLDFAERYMAQAVGAAANLFGLNKNKGEEALVAAHGDATALASTLPTREDLADAAVSLNPEDPASVRANLLSHWQETGQQPIDAAVQAKSDRELVEKLMREEFSDPLGPAIRGALKAAGSTVVSLAHIGETAFKAIADVTGSEAIHAEVTAGAARWKAREDALNKVLGGKGPAGEETSIAEHISSVLGQTIPTIAEYVYAGIPAMISYGALHGANEAYRETGSLAAAAAGATIGAAEAGAPAPFLHGLAGGNLIDGAVRGAMGMGIVGGLQTFADPIPRAVAGGDYAWPSPAQVGQGAFDAAIGGALFGAFGAARNPRVGVIDPSKPPGETVTEVDARAALAPIRPAEIEVPAEGGTPRFKPESTPAERIVALMMRADELRQENAGDGPLSSGRFFQDKLAEMGETDAATLALAKGHDTAWAGLRYLKGLAGDLWRDTQGAVPPLSEGERAELDRQQEAMRRPAERPELPAGASYGKAPPPPPPPKQAAPSGLDLAQRELEEAAMKRPREPRRPDSVSAKQREPVAPMPENTKTTTNLMRDTIIRHQALGEQNILHFAGLVDHVRYLLNPHMPEFEAELAATDGRPMETTIGRMLQDMEGRGEATVPGSGGQRFLAMLDPSSPLKPVVDLFRTINQATWLEIQARVDRGDINPVGYVHDYWRHLWADPNAAEAAWGAGKTGSSASLKARTIPTIADGLALGLKIKLTNPADLMNYDVASKLKFLHHLDTVHELENVSGIVVRGVRAPFAGAEQLTGRSTDRVTPDGLEHAWAPAAAARLYNNSMAAGWYAYPATASTYQKLMWLKNTSVGSKLIFPMFHTFVIAEQTLSTGLQQAWSELAAGNVGTSLLHVAKTVTIAPKAREIAIAGQKAIKAYADRTGDPIVQALVEAGARYGKRQFQYNMSAQGIGASIMQNKGHLIEAAGRQIMTDAKNTIGQEGEGLLKRAILFTPRVLGIGVSNLGRIGTTLSAPLFDYAIPSMKAGAGLLRAEQFLRLNPTASEGAIKTRTRQIVENVEDRFGEMNQDNLFWNKWVKQTANAASISTSWAYGTWRWLAAASGYNLERGVEWNPEATSSLVSAMVVYAGANAVMNYLNTGESPKDIWDFLNFRTGGRTMAGGVQRGLLPTEFKELYDMGRVATDTYLDPMSLPKGIFHYIAGKENPAVQAMTALLTGEDAVGHKISFTPKGWLGYFEEQVKPIVLLNIEKNQPGGGINAVERTFIREAPSWMEDPQRYVAQQEKLHDRWTKEELQRAGREAIAAGQEVPEGYKEPGGRSQGGGRQPGAPTGAVRVRAFLQAERARAEAGQGAQGIARSTASQTPAGTTVFRGNR